MSGADLDERLAHIEETLDELYAVVLVLKAQIESLVRTDHHGLGRGGMEDRKSVV